VKKPVSKFAFQVRNLRRYGAVRMHNNEWKESRGAMQSVILDQDEPAAVGLCTLESS
jgi:hypothetical protein